MNRTSAMPYTEAERERDAQDRADIVRRGVVRRKAAPNGHYNQQGTPELRQLWQRIQGESDE